MNFNYLCANKSIPASFQPKKDGDNKEEVYF